VSESRDLGSVSFFFEGIFDLNDVYRIVDDFTRMRGYNKSEAVNKEVVTEQGKDITIVFIPDKKRTDYIQKRLKIIVDVKDMQDVEVTIDDKKRKMQKGKIFLMIKAILVTDWDGRWEDRPATFFLRALFDKVFYKKHTDEYKDEVEADMNLLRDQLRGYLNMQKQNY